MTETELLFKQHAYDCPAVDDWIDENGGDIDTVRAFAPIAEMRGKFAYSKVSPYYKFQFTPDPNGSYRAVVLPVMEHGHTVDIVAFRQDSYRKKLDVWGTVTGAGRFLNRDAIYDRTRTEPLHVCTSWWQWLRTHCKGVLPLAGGVLSDLRDAGDIVVHDHAHALNLLYSAFIWPSADKDAARIEGGKHIWIDDGKPARAVA